MKVANPVEESWRVQLRAICTVSVRVDKEESTAFRHSASCQAATSHSVGTKEIWSHYDPESSTWIIVSKTQADRL